MPKIKYDNITFDSELEIEYYKKLIGEGRKFIYHPTSIQLNSKNKYTPDFIVEYDDRVEIVETKGYSQFSFMKDNLTHNIMLEKTADELADYIETNNISLNGRKPCYRKIKHLKAFGFVDFGFKNPNTVANKRKETIIELKKELKTAKEYIKKVDRYLNYLEKEKLTKEQKEFMKNFLEERKKQREERQQT